MKYIYVLRFAFYALFIGAVFGLATPLAAQEPVTDDEVNDVAKGLYCPVCESTPLDTCPTQACADWRELIRTQLSEGHSKEEIYDYFARQYGDAVLAAPPRRGFNLVLWFFPIVAVLVGGFFFSRFLRELRASGNSRAAPVDEREQGVPASPSGPVTGEYLARVERELQER